MNRQRTLLVFCCFILGTSLLAQPLRWMGQKKPYKWQFGISWNAVDDDGRNFCQPFDVNQSWNYPLFPSRLMIDRYLRKGFSVEFAGAYNNYQAGKLINDTVGLSGTFISIDLNAKLSFYQMLYPMKWLDPYVSLGVGGTDRQAMYPKTFVPTANAALGVNFWIYRNWGIQLQASSKFGITSPFYTSNTNYLQYSLGFVYKVPARRDRGTFHKKQYKWTKSHQKYHGGKRKNG